MNRTHKLYVYPFNSHTLTLSLSLSVKHHHVVVLQTSRYKCDGEKSPYFVTTSSTHQPTQTPRVYDAIAHAHCITVRRGRAWWSSDSDCEDIMLLLLLPVIMIDAPDEFCECVGCVSVPNTVYGESFPLVWV